MATMNINEKYEDFSALARRVAKSKDMDIDGHPVLEMSSDKLHHQDAERFRFVVDFGVKPYTPEMQSMYGRLDFSGFRDVIPTFDLKRAATIVGVSTIETLMVHVAGLEKIQNSFWRDGMFNRVYASIEQRRDDLYRKTFMKFTGLSEITARAIFDDRVDFPSTEARGTTVKKLQSDINEMFQAVGNQTGINPYYQFDPKYSTYQAHEIPMVLDRGEFIVKSDYELSREIKRKAEEKERLRRIEEEMNAILEQEALESNPLYGGF